MYNDSTKVTKASVIDGHANKEEQPTCTTCIFIVIYCLIYLLGVITNLMFTYLIFSRKCMREKYHFTASICVANLLFCFICIPIIICDFFNVQLTIGLGLGQVVTCLMFSATSLSLLSLAVRRSLVMSERFWKTSFTHVHKGKVKSVIVIWLVSLLVALPFKCTTQRGSSPFDLTELKEIDNDSHPVGSEHERNVSDFYSVCHRGSNTQATNCTLGKNKGDTGTPTGQCFIDMYLYTACLVGVLFLSVSVSLVLQTITMKDILKRPFKAQWRKQKQIAKQHIVLLIIFLICWLPLCIVSIIVRKPDLPNELLEAFNILAVSSVVYSPFIYYTFNIKIRREVKVCITKSCPCTLQRFFTCKD